MKYLSLYKQFFIGIICLLGYIIQGYASTSGKVYQDPLISNRIKSKEEYLSELKDKTIVEVKAILFQNKRELQTALDSLKDRRLSNNVVLSLTSGFESIERNKRINDVFKFIDVKVAQSDFKAIKRVEYVQTFSYPYSSFDYRYAWFFRKLNKESVDIDVVEGYYKGETKKWNVLGLYPADSLKAMFTYRYPTAYDSIVIDLSNKNTVKYKGSIINLHKQINNKVYLKTTPELRFIGNRGGTVNGDILKSTSSSTNPVLGLKPEVVKTTDNILKKIDRALSSDNLDNILNILYSFSVEDYTLSALLIDSYNIVIQFDDVATSLVTEYKLFNTLYSNYGAIFNTDYVMNIYEYSEPVTKVVLYVGKDFQEDTLVRMAYPEDKNLLPYHVFEDLYTRKYGVVNTANEIIIPAAYVGLVYLNSNYNKLEQHFYFRSIDENAVVSDHYLNLEKRELEPMDLSIRYIGSLGEYGVFYKSLSELGLYLGSKLMLPMKYTNYHVTTAMLIGEYTLRGRPKYDFYDLKGALLSTIPIKEIIDSSVDSSYIIVSNEESKQSIMDGNGKLIMPFEDIQIDALREDLFSYRKANKRDELYGVINARGGKPLTNRYIGVGKMHDGRALVRINKGEVFRYGYIDAEAKEVMPLIYDMAYKFIRGYALVVANGNCLLVDINGREVKNFGNAMTYYNEYSYSEDRMPTEDDDVVYVIDKKNYDYKGDMLIKK